MWTSTTGEVLGLPGKTLAALAERASCDAAAVRRRVGHLAERAQLAGRARSASGAPYGVFSGVSGGRRYRIAARLLPSGAYAIVGIHSPAGEEREGEVMPLARAIASAAKKPGQGLYTLFRKNAAGKLVPFSVGESGNLLQRMKKHQQLIRRYSGAPAKVFVSMTRTPVGTTKSQRVTLEGQRRTRAEKTYGVKTRDARELELALELGLPLHRL